MGQVGFNALSGDVECGQGCNVVELRVNECRNQGDGLHPKALAVALVPQFSHRKVIGKLGKQRHQMGDGQAATDLLASWSAKMVVQCGGIRHRKREPSTQKVRWLWWEVTPRGHRLLQLTASSLRFAALRSGFRQLLKAGVAMTSNVKSWQQFLLGFHDFVVLGASEMPELVRYDG
jgi:hypothetical protein